MKKLFKLTEKDLELISGGDGPITGRVIIGIIFGVKNNIPVVTPISRAVGNVIPAVIERQFWSNHDSTNEVINSKEEINRCNKQLVGSVAYSVAYGVAGTVTSLLPGVVGFVLGKRALNSNSSDKKAN